MATPKIAAKEPAAIELQPGKYLWCACGQSKNQPFCDGSHKTTEFKPVPFEIHETKKVWLCQCKHSSNKPYCDSTHRTL